MIGDTPRNNNRARPARDPDMPWDEFARFTSKLTFHRNPVLQTPCAVWVGSLDAKGYPLVGVNGRCRRAHRVSFEWYLERPLAPNEQIHHSCQNKACVNVQHLRLVSTAEHAALHRGPTCRRGHPRIAANQYVYVHRDGYVRARCIICDRDRGDNRRQQAGAAQERRRSA